MSKLAGPPPKNVGASKTTVVRRMIAVLPTTVARRMIVGLPTIAARQMIAGLPMIAARQMIAVLPTTVARRMIAGLPMIAARRMIAGHGRRVARRMIAGLPMIAARRMIAGLPTIAARRMIAVLPTTVALPMIAARQMIAVGRMLAPDRTPAFLPRIASARTNARVVHPAIETSRARPLPAALLNFALLLVGIEALAASDEAARQFRSGSTAFQAGDYSKALVDFEAALAAGMTGPAVHFNIGVAAYRSGDYSRAETAFLEAARTPSMAGLAHYNLGLVALARNDSATAADWFDKVRPATSDERLHALAASRLAELRPKETPRVWYGYAAFALGYDDNVALVSNSNVLGISDTEDSFADLQLAVSTPVADAWRLEGALMLTDYQDLDTFDQWTGYGGARYRWATGDWTHDAGLRAGYSLLDGSGFESRQTLSLQTRRGLRPDLYLYARYRLHHIDGLDEYSGISGLRHEGSAALLWTYADWDIYASYRLELADYDAATLSSTRHEVRVDVEHPINNDWTVQFDASLRQSDYDLSDYGVERRSDLGLAVTRTLSRRWRLVARYAYTQNKADLSDYDYRGNRFSAGVEATL
ncbi:tetratricopeptide repeat protein [Steroidobacter sp. S1-65]|uniref:Tetratricopeptide repeat protein n=1 Tax=Steroidobacter gossypii TaxID=2805490 RepID=A0ABS1WYQ0_9GAMM|nr:tetratricopeptide repeat protein [Steroidobacter gossypii]MBM0106106.1 tetratricopeptide repeat protein [Steroidobacter gossypii]